MHHETYMTEMYTLLK